MQRLAATIVTALLILALTLDVNVAALNLALTAEAAPCASSTGNAMVTIRDGIMKNIDPSRQYKSGQQIACTDTNICAFVQHFGGTVSGSQLAPLMQDLVDHHCTTCGRVPLNSIDVYRGELTVIHVDTIAVLKNGTILEQGCHKDLVAKKGAYYGLCSYKPNTQKTSEQEISRCTLLYKNVSVPKQSVSSQLSGRRRGHPAHGWKTDWQTVSVK